MFKSKKQIPNLSDADVKRALRIPANGQHLCDYLWDPTGKDTEYNVRGCKVQIDTIVIQTYSTNPFTLIARVGGIWYELASLDLAHPLIAAIKESGHFVDTGPSPVQIEKQRQREEEQRQQEQRQLAHNAARKKLCEDRIQAWELKRRRTTMEGTLTGKGS